MAYTHSKYEVHMVPKNRAISASGTATTIDGILIDVTGIVAGYTVGFVPHLIKGAGVLSSATVANTAIVPIGFEADITTPGTPTRAFTVILPVANVGHKSVFYRPTYEIEIKPGMEMTANVTAAATAAINASIILYVEPRWEEPANVTTMVATT